MSRFIIACSVIASFFSACSPKQAAIDPSNEKQAIAAVLDSLNRAAGAAHFEQYFALYADSAIFMGTDATEHWDKPAFMAFAKPYFDKGKAWSFQAIDRHIYLDSKGEFAWFDELLNTQMKICRGSGVLRKINQQWKIEQYVLSMTIPNSLTKSIVPMKTEEDSLVKRLTQ